MDSLLGVGEIAGVVGGGAAGQQVRPRVAACGEGDGASVRTGGLAVNPGHLNVHRQGGRAEGERRGHLPGHQLPGAAVGAPGSGVEVAVHRRAARDVAGVARDRLEAGIDVDPEGPTADQASAGWARGRGHVGGVALRGHGSRRGGDHDGVESSTGAHGKAGYGVPGLALPAKGPHRRPHGGVDGPARGAVAGGVARHPARPSAIPPPLKTVPAGHGTTALVVVAAAFVIGSVVATTWMDGATAAARPAASPSSEAATRASVRTLAIHETGLLALTLMAAIPPFVDRIPGRTGSYQTGSFPANALPVGERLTSKTVRRGPARSLARLRAGRTEQRRGLLVAGRPAERPDVGNGAGRGLASRAPLSRPGVRAAAGDRVTAGVAGKIAQQVITLGGRLASVVVDEGTPAQQDRGTRQGRAAECGGRLRGACRCGAAGLGLHHRHGRVR